MSVSQNVNNPQNQGVLYIVPTPIGNLMDITERAIATLSEVDLIAAEDTRHSKPLLQHLAIDKPLMALHDHNERQQAERLIKQLTEGLTVALISDAGTPLISDPGYHLVKQCRAAGVRVVALPGACAITTALSAAGLATDRFTFEGFLAAKPQQRRKQLNQLLMEPRTMVFYESPHRILSALEDVMSVFGDNREMVLARELTKQFETYLTGTVADIRQQLLDDSNQQRGEMVLMVTGHEAESQSDEPSIEAQHALQLLRQELPLKKAAAITAKLYDQRKNTLYQWGLENLN